MRILIYVLCYNKHSYDVATNEYGNKEGFKILYIETTPLLENIMYDSWLLENKYEWKDYDYVGTISWKASHKCRIPDMQTLINYVHNHNADIVPFWPGNCNLVQQATYHHPNFKSLWIKMFDQLNIPETDAMNPNVVPFFSNYWITKSTLMLKYIEFFRTAKYILDTYPDIQKELWEDSLYAGDSLSKEKCMELYEKPYYPYHVFIYERLPCYFFWSIGAKYS
jgi:hypothetical protein